MRRMKALGHTPPKGNTLFAATMSGVILCNVIYYSLIEFGKKKHLLLSRTALGLVAGIGALALTGPMGLHDAPVTRTEKTKLLTVAWYTIGGLVAAATIKALRR